MGSGIGFGSRGSRPYRKHNPIPALIVIGVLGVGAIAVWLNVVASGADINDAIRCEPPATAPPGITFTPVDHNALDGTNPIPPDKIALKVRNASSTRGQGAITTESLRALGFSQIGVPDNDPAYQGKEASCRGQIRFGQSGVSAARTLSLAAPCVELVRDNRKDASVDLSVGSAFGDVRPTAEGRKALEQLSAWSKQHPGSSGGGDQSAPGGQPALDQQLLAAARNAAC